MNFQEIIKDNFDRLYDTIQQLYFQFPFTWAETHPAVRLFHRNLADGLDTSKDMAVIESTFGKFHQTTLSCQQLQRFASFKKRTIEKRVIEKTSHELGIG